ncbi:MAG: hypothetical protein ABSG28_03555 [Methanoregula sp.]|jgi:hypothetical protein|uniref:DUF7490 domain-containing protein n=1 Tax=Methanoregula sp. TaxID=2052170 RepID=UPI003C2560D8
MYIRKFSLGVFVLLLVIALAAGAGCLSTTTVRDSSSGPVHTHYEYQDSWSPEYGCYTHLTGYVYNAGNVSTENLRLDFNLVNTGTGTIRDSKSIFVGSVGSGDTRTYETILDGECSQDYRVDFAFENL